MRRDRRRYTVVPLDQPRQLADAVRAFITSGAGRPVAMNAAFCQGPYDESIRYHDFMGWDVPWYSAEASLGALSSGATSA